MQRKSIRKEQDNEKNKFKQIPCNMYFRDKFAKKPRFARVFWCFFALKKKLTRFFRVIFLVGHAAKIPQHDLKQTALLHGTI